MHHLLHDGVEHRVLGPRVRDQRVMHESEGGVQCCQHLIFTAFGRDGSRWQCLQLRQQLRVLGAQRIGNAQD